MYIIPAIDLIDGRCVRLIQGNYHRQIVYNDNPLEQAKLFVDSGQNGSISLTSMEQGLASPLTRKQLRRSHKKQI